MRSPFCCHCCSGCRPSPRPPPSRRRRRPRKRPRRPSRPRRRPQAIRPGRRGEEGRCQAEEGKSRQGHGAADPQGRSGADCGLCGHAGGGPPCNPDRPGVDRRLQRHSERRIRRSLDRRRESVPGAQRRARHRPPDAGAAHRARRRRQGEAAGGGLAGGRRSGERRSARHSDQARPAGEPGQDRHALELGARRGADRDVPHRRARHDARRRVRAAEEGARDPQGRIQRDARQFLRAVRPAGIEAVLSARTRQGQRGARHADHVRPGDAGHHGPDRGRDVEPFRAVPGRARRTAAAAQGRVRDRHRGGYARPRRHRSPGDRRLQRDRAAGARQRRVHRRRRRSRAAARLWRARSQADRVRRRARKCRRT